MSILNVENIIVIYFPITLCLFITLAFFIASSFCNEPRPVSRGRAAGCSRHRRPPIFCEFEICARSRICDKSDTLSHTWRPSVELLILRQFNSMLPLTIGDLRIAGINRRRSVKVAVLASTVAIYTYIYIHTRSKSTISSLITYYLCHSLNSSVYIETFKFRFTKGLVRCSKH